MLYTSDTGEKKKLMWSHASQRYMAGITNRFVCLYFVLAAWVQLEGILLMLLCMQDVISTARQQLYLTK